MKARIQPGSPVALPFRHLLLSVFSIAILCATVLVFAGCATGLSPEQAAAVIARNTGFEDARILYIHGAGDGPGRWASALAARRGGFAFDWEMEARDRMAAPERGYVIGRLAGARLLAYRASLSAGSSGGDAGSNDEAAGHSGGGAAQGSSGQLTIYAHSAGAWVAQGIADALADADSPPKKAGSTTNGSGASGAAGTSRREAPRIVFLDPFTARSILRLTAGRTMLGRNCAQTETWFTTRDSIPFTAGKVAAGRIFDMDPLSSFTGMGKDAHWAVIDWYFSWRADQPEEAVPASR